MQMFCEASVTDEQAEEPLPEMTVLFLGQGVPKTEIKRQLQKHTELFQSGHGFSPKKDVVR